MEEYDDIDLRPYLLAVARRWYWIVAATLLAAAIAAGISMQMPKSYTATASLVLFIRQTVSQVGVNQSIISVETIDIAARRQGLLALARSNAIEAQIRPEDLQRVAPADYQPGVLTGRINVEADGDLISISAHAPSPEQAQVLADVWANTYVGYVKTLYNDEHSQVQLAGKALLPAAPSGPQISRNLIFAGLLGASAAVALILILTLVRQTLARPDRARDSRAVAVRPGRSVGQRDGQPIASIADSPARRD
jgi:capsular polysaccharide biosynthesis protein